MPPRVNAPGAKQKWDKAKHKYKAAWAFNLKTRKLGNSAEMREAAKKARVASESMFEAEKGYHVAERKLRPLASQAEDAAIRELKSLAGKFQVARLDDDGVTLLLDTLKRLKVLLDNTESRPELQKKFRKVIQDAELVRTAKGLKHKEMLDILKSIETTEASFLRDWCTVSRFNHSAVPRRLRRPLGPFRA